MRSLKTHQQKTKTYKEELNITHRHSGITHHHSRTTPVIPANAGIWNPLRQSP